MKKINIFLIILFASVLVMSCDTRSVQEIEPVITNPVYSKDIKPIFDAKCVGCHSNYGQQPVLTNYSKVKEAVQYDVVLCAIGATNTCFKNNYMPPSGRMSQTLINRIKAWAENGYPE